MTPLQLYSLVQNDLYLLDLDNNITLCSMKHMFPRYTTCGACPYYNEKAALGNCRLDLRNANTKELKHIIITKHPELLI